MKKAFQFKIQIEGINNPTVWRRIIVPDAITFEQFHLILQTTFGWSDTHLFQFCPQSYGSQPTITHPDEEYEDYIDYKGPFEDSRTITLKEIFHTEKQQFTYIYDFDDHWHLVITLEAIVTNTFNDVSCIAGEGACPPEGCGGAIKYEYLKEIMSNPKDPEYEEKREWLELKPEEKWSAYLSDPLKEIKFDFYFRMPAFNHPEVKTFYDSSFDLDKNTLNIIMALPRQTLIEDMQTMLTDCIKRVKYFKKYDASKVFLPMHAIYVLSSLRAEESLDTMLFVMSQEEDTGTFWFGDLVPETFWQYIYLIGQNQTEKLMSYLCSENDISPRCVIIDVFTQIAIRQPERKQEMVNCETRAIEYLLANIDNEAIFNDFLLECLVCDLIAIGDINALPLIKRCLDTGQVSLIETGSLSEIEEKLGSEIIDRNYYNAFKIHEDLDQFYDEWKKWTEQYLW